MSKKTEDENLNTAYDDAYHTLLTDCPQLIVPVVNEVFHRQYAFREDVKRSNEKYFINRQDGGQLQRIADSNIEIKETKYHIECQSTVDGSMVTRMFEYGAQSALNDSTLEESVLTVEFPHVAVLYLRHNSKTPENMKIRIKTPDAECSYNVPIVKLRDYSLDEIFNKQLYFLIPFHIFTYEKKFIQLEKDEAQLKELKLIYGEIVSRLNECAKTGKITEYEKRTIMTMGRKVLRKIAAKYQNVKEGIGEIMGGKVLDYEAKDILNQGISQGIRTTARKMLEENLPVEQIIKFTGLTMEEILSLQQTK